MKDRQVQASAAQPGIPIVSSFLHWLAMPAIVFLRSRFGYSFLNSKGVFLCFAWASFLYFIYCQIAPDGWIASRAFAAFAAGASLLYILHLSAAFIRETRRKGRHDSYAGTSHLLRLPGLSELRGNVRFVTGLHLWAEPGAVLVAAAVLKGFFGEQKLSLWLIFVAAGLWFKEFINYWYGLRADKKHGDIIEDAEEKMPEAGNISAAPPPAAGGRKPRPKRPPMVSEEETEELPEEQRHADALRLMPPHPPYDLKQAEENYLTLMKAAGANLDSPSEPGGKAATLTEAIEFFRQRNP